MNAVLPSKLIDSELVDIQGQLRENEPEQCAELERAEYQQVLAVKRGVFEHRSLRSYLWLFSAICEMNAAWRQRVFRGEEELDRKKEADLRELLSLWLGMNDKIRQRTEFFERHGPRFDGNPLLNLRLYAEEARKILQNWRPPVLSKSVALRTATIPAETATKLREILAE